MLHLDDSTAARYAEVWNLFLGGSIATPSGLLFRGRRGCTPIVLKLPRPGSDERQQGCALRHFAGRGAVRLLETDGKALLLEALVPGDAAAGLALAGRDDEATRVFCRVAGSLHSAPDVTGGFTPVSDLAAGFDRFLSGVDRRLSAPEVLRAREIFLALAGSQAKVVLLHGDLHHGNILFDAARGWVSIDPKGYVGEPAYEAGAWLRNPLGHPLQAVTRDRIVNRLSIIAAETDWTAERVVRWSYAQAVLAAIWAIEDGQDPSPHLVAAGALGWAVPAMQQ